MMSLPKSVQVFASQNRGKSERQVQLRWEKLEATVDKHRMERPERKAGAELGQAKPKLGLRLANVDI